MDATALLLSIAFRHRVNEPTPEAAHARLEALAGHALDAAAFRDAVAACLRDRLIHDPVRLPDGALQCHWHLELTPLGVAAARALLPASPKAE